MVNIEVVLTRYNDSICRRTLNNAISFYDGNIVKTSCINSHVTIKNSVKYYLLFGSRIVSMQLTKPNFYQWTW